jgi:hypothetical protein
MGNGPPARSLNHPPRHLGGSSIIAGRGPEMCNVFQLLLNSRRKPIPPAFLISRHRKPDEA